MTANLDRSPPRLYSDLAAWWPLLSPPAEYAEEAAFYQHAFLTTARLPVVTMLELGCGGGNNASYLKRRFEMVLTDVSPDMLEMSRALNPECDHIQGDMRSIRLGREFDAVFVHDAVVYMTSVADLRQAIETARLHCKPGGIALFAPDHVRENFRPSTDHGGHDSSPPGPLSTGGEGGRALRYLEWTWDPDPSDTTYLVDYAYLLRDTDGSVRVESDRHVEGLFSRGDWLRLLAEAGFEPQVLPFNHSELEPGEYEIFVAVKAE